MKRILSVLAILALMMPFALHAQETTGYNGTAFTGGIKVGINFSNYIKKSNMLPGGEAGLFIRAGRKFYFEPAVMYSFRSTNFKDLKNEIKESFEVGQHFIDVPLLLGYKFVNNRNFNFRIFFGPRVGFRVGSDYDNINDLVGYAQWGVGAGIGIDFWIFTFDVKYDFSICKFKEYDEKTFWEHNLMNAVLGVKFKR